MVFAYYGLVIPEDQVAAACGTRPFGTYPKQAVAAAHHYGFKDTSNGPLSFRTLREKASAGLLPITYISMRIQTHHAAHAVVVYEITGEADEDLVRFIDPALEEPGEGEMSVAEFKTSWQSTIIVSR
jgi:ABC-type bacteriocin/lantibiotic exporter with double-glycine peptidase domain